MPKPYGFTITTQAGKCSIKKQKKDFYLAFYRHKLYTNFIEVLWGVEINPLFSGSVFFVRRFFPGSVRFSFVFKI